MKVLFEMGTSGAVSGDCFVKIAYEEAWEDSIGLVHPGRVRLLPLNAAYCFPEYHPHDRSRLIRFKIKYRFYGTSPQGTRSVYTYVEVLTETQSRSTSTTSSSTAGRILWVGSPSCTSPTFLCQTAPGACRTARTSST